VRWGTLRRALQSSWCFEQLACGQARSLSTPYPPPLWSRRQHLQLYKLLTGLSWDAATALEGRAKGHVVDTAAGDVRPFDFDAREMEPVALADALWGVIA
jgi:hypothetical protein